MDNLYNYITDPETIINFVVFVFWLGMAYANLNNRIKKNEETCVQLKDETKEIREDLKKIDLAKLETKLAKIEADLERLKEAWMKKHK